MNQELYDQFLTEFLKEKFTDRQKIVKKIRSVHDTQIARDTDTVQKRVLGLFQFRKMVDRSWAIKHLDRWFFVQTTTNQISIWPVAEFNPYVYVHQSQMVMILIGKANDDALRAKIEKTIGVILAKQVIES